ncbi:MAG: hypothetical protein ACRDH9_13780 [Actinomycetota bacterium]
MSEAALDLALRDLGEHLAWPEEADLASRVNAGVENVAPLRPRRRRRVVLVSAAALLVLTALLAVSPGLRAAILRFFGIRGAEVEVHETVSPPSGPSFTGEALLGEPVTQAEAADVLGFPLVLPEGLGKGEGVYLLREGATTIATVAYREGELLLSQFRGRVERATVTKTVSAGQAEYVEVNGSFGIWVQGPHTVFIRDPSGDLVPTDPLRGGNTLLWSVEDVTFRLEGAAELSSALRIAESVVV